MHEYLIQAVADALLDVRDYHSTEGACTRIELARADAETMLGTDVIARLLDVCTRVKGCGRSKYVYERREAKSLAWTNF